MNRIAEQRLATKPAAPVLAEVARRLRTRRRLALEVLAIGILIVFAILRPVVF